MGCHSGKSTVSAPSASLHEQSLGSKPSSTILQDAGIAKSEDVSAATTASSSACASSRDSASSSATTPTEEDTTEDHAIIICHSTGNGGQPLNSTGAACSAAGSEVATSNEGLQCNHYGVLGLSSTCSASEIRRSYLDLLKICHPDRADRSAHMQNATSAWFRNVNIAYVVLSDPNTRHAYDVAFGFAVADNVDSDAKAAGAETTALHNRDTVLYIEDDCAATNAEADEQAPGDTSDSIMAGVQLSSQLASWWQGMLVQMQIPSCVPMIEKGNEVDLSHSLARRSKASDTPCACSVDTEDATPPGCNASSSSAKLSGSMTPTLKVKEWQFKLKLEIKSIERDLKQLQRDETRLTRKKSMQEQKSNAKGAEAAAVFASSLAEAQCAYAKLEQICDVARAVNLDLTTCLYSMKSPGTLVTADVLQKLEKISDARGSMQEVLDDVLQFLALANCDDKHAMTQSTDNLTMSLASLPEAMGVETPMGSR